MGDFFKSRIIGCLNLIVLTMKMSDLRFAQIAITIKVYGTLQIKDYWVLKFNSVDRENVRSQVCTDCKYNQGNDRWRGHVHEKSAAVLMDQSYLICHGHLRGSIVIWCLNWVGAPQVNWIEHVKKISLLGFRVFTQCSEWRHYYLIGEGG